MKPIPSVKFYYSIFNARYTLPALLLFCSLFSLQCKKEIVTTNSSARLSFSTNLLFFDTVFVKQGSSARIFVVHNYNNQAIVTSIKLQGSYTSPFKINVDGQSGTNFTNVKIPANDSIYVFTQVNIDPLNVNNPSLVKDSLVFTTNGNIQWVDLQAYGWNAYYYYPNIFPASGSAYSVIDASDSVWRNDKPHVVFGYLIVPGGYRLRIDAGAGVYMHDSAVIWVDSAATLDVTGNSNSQVTFQGDRLEPAYKYIPGQWNAILLYKTSNCDISWAVIQNGTTGIQADSSINTIKIHHTIIKSMSSYGLLALGATITSDDCLIADCQYSCVVLYYGGTYTFNQCTFADYWGVDNSYGQRTTALLQMNNHYTSVTGQPIYRPINKAFFGNCIIYGALNEEVNFDSASSNDLMNYYFENCVIKTAHTYPGNHVSNLYLQDPLFTSPAADNYEVNAGSPAINNASDVISAQYPIDLNGKTRPPSGATIGAYEK